MPDPGSSGRAGVLIPEEVRRFSERGPEWVPWVEALPALVRDVLAEWELVVDGPSTNGFTSLVLPVQTTGGEAAIAKFGWPHEEAEHEHLALRLWDGANAVRLLRADPRRQVLLLERAQQRDLTTLPVLEACEVVATLYARLHVPAPPQLRLLSVLAADWAERLRGLPRNAPLPHRYVDQAAGLADAFASDAETDGRMIHTDLHYFNVLASAREADDSWLVIDPKPVSGDPCFEIAPLLWNRWDEVTASGGVRDAIRERFFTVVDTAGLDEDRARDWTVVFEVVNAMWTLEDIERAGTPAAKMSDEDAEWITRCVTIAKAVQG